MPTEQSTQYALKQIIAGRTAADIARELGIDQNILTQKLRKLPEYREYRRKQNAEREALKKKALELAAHGLRKRTISRKIGVPITTVGSWLKAAGVKPLITDTTEQRREALRLAYMGIRPARIKKMVGVTYGTVYKWLREAGFDTSDGADSSLPCPACGGRMKKQELFFWQCQCGGEWWPSEDMVPDNPDEWTTAAKLNVDPEAINLICQLLDEGKTHSEIAEALNRAGYKPPGSEYDRENPDEWTVTALNCYINRHGLKGDYSEQRERVEQICEEMALKGYNCQEIADRLNAEGLKTRMMRAWTKYAVLQVVRKLLPDHELSRGFEVIGQVELPDRMKPDVHPWRRDAEICYAKAKARRKK